MRIVLASNSPRRRDLLRQIGISFEQIACPTPEPNSTGQSAVDHVVHSARFKAWGVRGLLDDGGTSPALVIGADTVVCIDSTILGKPEDEKQGCAMLRQLSGRVHRVYTGIVLLCSDGIEIADSVSTDVTMKSLSQREIQSYVRSGEPVDKAGAYGIQGMAARFVERVDGCYYNVVGLPLSRLCDLLEEAGYRFP